ncbi:MAG TPA: molybdopterin-binding protein, partial [Tichowtungia sp.]|nr:molybdopterin-binding protein [Tichowtungia sp.]
MKTDIELISIGTELLSGRTLNTHAQTLGGQLAKIGLKLSRDTTIPDVMDTIQSAVREAFERVDIVVVSGGLGPTVDDITRDALAGLVDTGIVLSDSALEAIKARYASRGYPFTPAAERQALVLEGADVLLNSAGCAPGERLDFPDIEKTLFITPGPPVEFSAVLEEHIIPWLRKRFPDAVPDGLRVLMTQGIGESLLVTHLEQAGFHNLPALRDPEGGVAIGFYPGSGKVEIRL